MLLAATMMTADLAFVLLVNRTSAFYEAKPPVYMTYVETAHISAPLLKRAQDVNRSVAVRIADNFAVMRDLPQGAERTGQAFPVVAYYNAFSDLSYHYYAFGKWTSPCHKNDRGRSQRRLQIRV
jgi:hypothetical protein